MMPRIASRPRRRLLTSCVAALLLPTLAAGCTGPNPDTAAMARAIEFFVDIQNEDGGFGAAPGSPSDPSVSCWVALALASGRAPSATRSQLSQYLGTQVHRVLQNETNTLSRINAVALFVLAARALPASIPPHRQAALEGRLSEAGQNRSLGLNEEIIVLGALGAAGRATPDHWLALGLTQRLAGTNATLIGSDSWYRSYAILALLAVGVPASAPEMRDAARSLRPFQQEEGGYRSDMDLEPDASTTAAVVSVFSRIAFVYSPERATASAYVRSLQQPDGSVRFSEAIDFARVKTTAEAVLAWSGTGPFAVGA